MRHPRSILVAFCLLAGLVVGGAGCNTYRYFDVQVTFDATANPPFTKASAFSVAVCQVTVSGAAHDSFKLPDGTCPDMRTNGNPLSGGAFEYSTFADSGNITFALDAFQDVSQADNCKIGSGTLTLPVTGIITTTGELKIKMTGMSCKPFGGIQADGGSISVD